jgi:hypothetical protein
MNDGSTITGNTGMGVYVGGTSGTFRMNGGTISGNTNGSGVYMENGTFTMNGGTISGNTVGVQVLYSGNFTMNGGTISGNTSTSGGGVYMGGSGTFTMSGGVYVVSNEFRGGTFAKTGGTITGFASDQAKGNAVKEANGNARNFRGHAVYAPGPKIREGTAGPEDTLSWSRKAVEGAWDN